MMQLFSNEYDYCAFISFNSNDASIANWLKRRLDKFNIPAFIKAEHQIPNKHLKPSFTYLHSSEAGNELRDELEKKLIRSRFLIIICSPNSAQSAICDWEIETFINLGRKDFIIPLVIDGIPYSKDAETECLSPALLKEFPSSPDFHLDKSIKCANLKEKGISCLERKDHAFAQIVSRILNVNFDKIWEKVHNKNKLKYASLSVLIALLLFVGIQLFNYYKTSYDYYIDYADCNGLPCGIMPVEKGDLYNYPFHYRFESTQGRLRRVVFCNSHGFPQDHSHTETKERPAIIEVGYDSSDGLTLTKSDRVGRVLYRETISPNRLRADLKANENNDAATLVGATTAMFKSDNTDTQDGTFNPYTFQNNSKSEITIITYERDSDGYITKKLFKKVDGARLVSVPDMSGVYGVAYERDSLHRVIKESYLGKNGVDLVNNHQNISYKEHEYDVYGNISSTFYYDRNGNLTTNELGCAIIRLKATKDNAIQEETYYDINGDSCIALHGCFKRKIYLEKGFCVKVENYSLTDSLTYAWTNPSIEWIGGEAITKCKYDKQGRLCSISFYNTAGEPCYNHAQVHENRFEYNDAGDIISQTSYNTLGHRWNSRYGHSKEVYEYDEDHNLLLYKCLGVNDQPVNSNAGISIKKQEFKDGRVVRQSYYNMAGLPIHTSYLNDAASIEIDYDELGNPIEIRFYDYNDSLCRNDMGFAVCAISYDENTGKISEYSYYADAEKQEPCMHEQGYSCIQFSYYENGLINEITIPNDNNITGIARGTIAYDDQGNIIEQKYYDRNNRLAINEVLDFAICRNKYNSYNQPLEEAYFDENDKPHVPYNKEYHCIKASYNEYALMTSLEYYDSDDNPCEVRLPNGYYVAKIVYEYIDGILPCVHLNYNANEDLIYAEYLLYDDNKNTTAIRVKVDYRGNKKIDDIFTANGRLPYSAEEWDKYEKLLTERYGVEFD